MAAFRQRATTEPAPAGLRSVERALAVLQVLAGQPAGATPKEIGRALDLHLSTVYRLLNTLVGAGYVDRCGETGLFRLGPRIAQLYHVFLETLGPDADALPLLHALQATTGETIHLVRRRGTDAVLTASVTGTRPGFVPGGYPGLVHPLHATAAGRALLAWLPAPVVTAHLARLVPDRRFPDAETDLDALRAELTRIRVDGYALDRGRLVSCVAAPARRPDGAVVAAIAIVMQSSRFASEYHALVPAIVAVGHALGAVLSADPDASGVPIGPRPEPDPVAAAALSELIRTPSIEWARSDM